MKLLNKNVIITGGNQGFGLAVAEAYLKEGANVIICARDEEKLKKATDYLDKFCFQTSQLYSLKADISKPADNKEIVEFALKKFNKIDILVANAGIYGPKGSIEDVLWEEWSHAIDINLKGTVLTCKEVVSVMKKQKFGKIIILSGGGATKAMPYLSAYAVSKAAIVRFSDTLAEEVKSFNIDVNSIAPGALNTRLLDEILESGPEKVGKSFYEQSLKQKETGGAPVEKGWKIEDGVIHRHAKGGDIITKASYKNFELSFEWKISKAGNSGVKYRTKGSLGLEYQVLDDQNHPDRKIDNHLAASMYEIIAAPDDKPIKPVGEWNKARIVAKGNHIEHWLNGVKVIEIEYGSDDWKERFQKSKYSKRQYKKNEGFGSWEGPILLQDHQDPAWFRNLLIKKLD